MDSQTFNFRCGCFLRIWAEADILQSALACCEEHEASEQTLDKILADGKELVIDDKYIPPLPRPTLDEELKMAASKYPDITMHKGFGNLNGYGNVIEFTLPLSDAWNKKSVKIGFLLPLGYPGNHPGGPGLIGFWSVGGDLRTSYGAYPNRTDLRYIERKADTGERPCLVHFGSLQHWNPNHDTILTYARTIDWALNRGKKGQK
jgi:hypothetical protein